MGMFDKMIDTVAKKALIDTAGEAVAKVAGAVMENTNININTDASVKIPKGSGDYRGHNYEEVKEELQAYGFVNIALLPKKDLLKGWMTKDGAVEEISISGKTDFKKGQRYHSTARIVITYHTFRHAHTIAPPVNDIPPIQEGTTPVWTETPHAPKREGPAPFGRPNPEENHPRQIKCKNCSGIMDLGFDKSIATCPYCGSSETIAESDSVKIERMRRKAEAERQACEKAEDERQERKNAIESFKRKPLSKAILIAAFLALLLAISNFRYRTFASIVMVSGGAVLAFSWFVGAGLTKNTKQDSYIIFTIVGFALLIIAFSLG